jgi:hypothetical protein
MEQQEPIVHNETPEEALAVEDSTRETVPRRGDVEKCPVCGSRVDAEAFHCPTCHSYFCFHCRGRLLPGETQLQCVSQSCDYYGKLICGLCDPQAEKDEPPTKYLEPEDGYWPAWLAAVLLVAAVSLYYFTFLTSLIEAVVLFLLGGWLLNKWGFNLFGKVRAVEQQRKTRYHTCIHCLEPVKSVTSKHPGVSG